MAYKDTFASITAPLVCDCIDGTYPLCYARRPAGTRDWLLTYTLAGGAMFRHRPDSSDFFRVRPGELTLFPPRVYQDYGTTPALPRWKNIWVHFLPPQSWLDHLHWPEISPGLMHLRLENPSKKNITRELHQMVAFSKIPGPRGMNLAMNALERALLFIDAINPRFGTLRQDPRIRATVDYLGTHIAEHHTIARLAARVEMSRSAFAELFTRQMQLSPARYIETLRLHRVRTLLLYTTRRLEDLAGEFGFSSAFHLSARFKHHFGISPHHYRHRHPH